MKSHSSWIRSSIIVYWRYNYYVENAVRRRSLLYVPIWDLLVPILYGLERTSDARVAVSELLVLIKSKGSSQSKREFFQSVTDLFEKRLQSQCHFLRILEPHALAWVHQKWFWWITFEQGNILEFWKIFWLADKLYKLFMFGKAWLSKTPCLFSLGFQSRVFILYVPRWKM